MNELDFEQRHRLEHEVLPAVVDDPETAAWTIVRLEAEVQRLKQKNARLCRMAEIDPERSGPAP